MFCDDVRFFLYFLARVRHGDGEAAIAHDREIDDVVADERRLGRLQVRFFQDSLEAGELVLNSLMDMFDFQVAGPQGDSFGDALGDQPGLDSAEARQ